MLCSILHPFTNVNIFRMTIHKRLVPLNLGHNVTERTIDRALIAARIGPMASGRRKHSLCSRPAATALPSVCRWGGLLFWFPYLFLVYCTRYFGINILNLDRQKKFGWNFWNNLWWQNAYGLHDVKWLPPSATPEGLSVPCWSSAVTMECLVCG